MYMYVHVLVQVCACYTYVCIQHPCLSIKLCGMMWLIQSQFKPLPLTVFRAVVYTRIYTYTQSTVHSVTLHVFHSSSSSSFSSSSSSSSPAALHAVHPGTDWFRLRRSCLLVRWRSVHVHVYVSLTCVHVCVSSSGRNMYQSPQSKDLTSLPK